MALYKSKIFNRKELKLFRHNFKKSNRRTRAKKLLILQRHLSNEPNKADRPLSKEEKRILLEK